MGINNPNVRWVIHSDLPKNVEGYYQETGRAGRDGLPADCLLLFSRGDVMKYLKFLDEIPDEQAREVAHRQLDQMTHFAESDRCRRIGLLGYFGETWELENCGACDHCLHPREKWDATVDVQKLLSCVLRIRQAGNFNVGLNHISEVLTGGMSEKIIRWQHDRLSTHGIGKDQARSYWVDLGRQLLRAGLLAASTDKFPTVSVSHQGLDVLKKRETVLLTRAMSAPRTKTPRTGEIPCDSDLFEKLRSLRKSLADARNIPPYVVFSDVTLRHFSREYPSDTGAMLRIPGVGEKKLADYGHAFMDAIREWLSSQPRQAFTPLDPPLVERQARTTPAPLGGSPALSVELFKSGQSIAEIARTRGLVESTIENHLAQAIENGNTFDPHAFYTIEEEQEMRTAFEGYEETSHKPVYEHLGGRISYGKLRLYRAMNRFCEPAP
jgi:ATP-dependent DNA helicase RecQ